MIWMCNNYKNNTMLLYPEALIATQKLNDSLALGQYNDATTQRPMSRSSYSNLRIW